MILVKCARCGKERMVRFSNYSREKTTSLCLPCFNKRHEENEHKWYISVSKPDHPRANCMGRVRRSVLLMEKYLGRFLSPEEEVHHINGIKTDDRIENLELTTHSEHAKKNKGRPFYGNQYRHLTAKAV